MRRVVALLVIAATMVGFTPRPALACSCAWPPDIPRWVETSAGAFVGTVIGKGLSPLQQLGDDVTHVLEVERWIKGGPAERIELDLPGDTGGNCGVNLDMGQRVGMLLHESEGKITSSSCSTFEPELLLDFEPLIPDSPTKVPFLLMGTGEVIEALDREGRLVTRLDSRRRHEESGQAWQQYVSLCPGGRRFVHATSATLALWDTSTLELADRVDISSHGAISHISCRDEDASEVLLVTGDGAEALVEAISGEVVLRDLGTVTGIGLTHVTVEDFRGGIGRVDLETGGKTDLLPADPAGKATSLAWPSPFDNLTAVLTTSWENPSTSTLRLFRGEVVVRTMEFDTEVWVVGWLDDSTVMVLETMTEELLMIDAEDDSFASFEGTPVWQVVTDGQAAYGIFGSELVRLERTSKELVATLPEATPSFQPLIVLPEAQEVTEDHTVLTTPAIVGTEGTESGDSTFVARLTLGVLLVLAAGVVAWRKRSAEQE